MTEINDNEVLIDSATRQLRRAWAGELEDGDGLKFESIVIQRAEIGENLIDIYQETEKGLVYQNTLRPELIIQFSEFQNYFENLYLWIEGELEKEPEINPTSGRAYH